MIGVLWPLLFTPMVNRLPPSLLLFWNSGAALGRPSLPGGSTRVKIPQAKRSFAVW